MEEEWGMFWDPTVRVSGGEWVWVGGGVAVEEVRHGVTDVNVDAVANDANCNGERERERERESEINLSGLDWGLGF